MTRARRDQRGRKKLSISPRFLFSAWTELAECLRNAGRIALFLDFDGTLAEIRSRPEQVCLHKSVRRVLVHLAKRPEVTVAIISGRTLHDLRKRVGIPSVRYFGLLGLEQDGHKPELPGNILAALNLAKAAVKKHLEGLPGIWLEDKKLSFAVHTRGATPEDARAARQRLRSAIRPSPQSFRMVSGRKVWEILPQAIPRKGETANEFLAHLPKSTLPIYIGDDAVDESAFHALRRGITVRVGLSSRTRARFWLRNPDDVFRFLQKLEEELCSGPLNPSVS